MKRIERRRLRRMIWMMMRTWTPAGLEGDGIFAIGALKVECGSGSCLPHPEELLQASGHEAVVVVVGVHGSTGHIHDHVHNSYHVCTAVSL
jgi:hypothetical protein